MRLLRRGGATPHQRTVQMRRQRADILRHIGRQLQGPRQNHRRLREGFREEIAEMLGRGRVDAAGGNEVHGAREPDQARQEVRRAGLHGDAAAAEHEPVLALLVGDAHHRGQGHGHSDADGRALHRDDGGFAASVDGQGAASATGQESVPWDAPRA